jgi:hypothetical protein
MKCSVCRRFPHRFPLRAFQKLNSSVPFSPFAPLVPRPPRLGLSAKSQIVPSVTDFLHRFSPIFFPIFSPIFPSPIFPIFKTDFQSPIFSDRCHPRVGQRRPTRKASPRYARAISSAPEPKPCKGLAMSAFPPSAAIVSAPNSTLLAPAGNSSKSLRAALIQETGRVFRVSAIGNPCCHI